MNQKFEKIKKDTTPKRETLKNTINAFISGGMICLLAQVISYLIEKYFKLDKNMTSVYTVIIMIFLASILTGFGVYDRLGQFSGAGTIIPITGFANSMTSSALESKSEGLILGILTNMFKLAGSVIVTGVVTGVVVGLIRYLLGV